MLWHPGPSHLQFSPSKVRSRSSGKHVTWEPARTARAWAPPDQTLSGAEPGDGPPSAPPAGRHQAQGRAHHCRPLSLPTVTQGTPGAQDALPRVHVQGTPPSFDQPFFHPQVSQGLALRKGHSCDPHLRVSISGARLCFSWDLQAGLRALPAEAQETWNQRPAPGTPRLDIPGSWTDNGSSHGRRGGRHGGADNGPVFLPHAFLQPHRRCLL